MSFCKVYDPQEKDKELAEMLAFLKTYIEYLEQRIAVLEHRL